MKKIILILFLWLLFQTNIMFSHGFGGHSAHLQKLVELNLSQSNIELINHPKYSPYFLYGSMFPDIQYTSNYKDVLEILYSKIRNVKIYEVSEINVNQPAFDGLTYELPLSNIPDDDYVFGIDTHDDKYAMRFAEYLLNQANLPDPPGPDPGSDGSDSSDSRNMKLAFALGYYAHLCEDIAAHNFLVPKVAATLDLGDIELVKASSTFPEDPNSQTEGIVEGIIDHLYGNNTAVKNTVFWDVWVTYYQLEPSITQMDFTTGTPHTLYGPNWEFYMPENNYPETNPVLLFFHETLTDWYNNNPDTLATTGEDKYKKTNSPITIDGLVELAEVFRFVNRFYPSIAGHSDFGYERLDQVLSDWISSHLDLSAAATAYGLGASSGIFATVGGVFGLPLAASTFFASMLTMEFNVNFLAGIAYPGILDGFSDQMSADARSLVTLMLSDMTEADKVANANPSKINLEEYNKLKNNVLFTDPQSHLDPLWEEYLELGCIIYNEIGPGSTPNWYNDWSPWHSQSMSWGALSSLNKLLPSIYESNPNIAVYDAYFLLGGGKISGPVDYNVIVNNSTAKINLEIYNTKNIASQNIKLQVRRDHNSSSYSSDQIIANTTFPIDHNPQSYGSTNRLTKELTFNISAEDLNDNNGYYFELVNPTTNKAIFTSSFEQYAEQLSLTPNYSSLYSTYNRWPYSLGVVQNIATISLNVPQLTEESSTGGSFLINGIEGSSIQIPVNNYFNIEAIPPSDEYVFCRWSDGNMENPRNYRSEGTTTLTAEMKKLQSSNNSSAYSSSSQRKFVYNHGGSDCLASVYESMGKIWLEGSYDDGATWQILNNGSPLNGTTTASNPSIDNTQMDGHVVIVYQESNDIKVIIFNLDIYDQNPIKYTGSVHPVYAGNTIPVVKTQSNYANNTELYLIVWKEDYVNPFSSPGLYYRCLEKSGSGYTYNFINNRTKISNTNVNSTNPTLAAKNDQTFFHLAWEQLESSGMYVSEIKYYRIDRSSQNVLSFAGYYTPSAGGLCNENSSPTMAVSENGGMFLAWKGDDYNGQSSHAVYRYYYYFWYSTFYKYGEQVTNVSLNSAEVSYYHGLAFAEGNSNHYIASTISGIQSLNTSGNYIQLANGLGSVNNMQAMTFKNTSVPYTFTVSEKFGTGLSKTNSSQDIEGREGLVSYPTKDNAETEIYYFAISDIKVDGKPIKFVELHDTVMVKNIDDLNKYLTTESFELSSLSELTYNASFGLADGEKETKQITNGKKVKFHVELVGAEDKKVLGIYEQVDFKSGTNESKNKNTYKITPKLKKNNKVSLRLVVEDDDKGQYLISSILSKSSVLGKAGAVEIVNSGNLIVEEYQLTQNYPNPFNPQTTINYQLPKDGLVTLKVYDALGKEVAELVNGYKSSGSYNVTFDGSNLASGIYFYKITSGKFTSTKKLMLMK